MASEDDKKPTLAAIVALLSLAAGGYLLYQDPLISSRPIQLESSDKRIIHGDDRVQARLLEDPFEAVQSHREKERDEQRKLSSLSDLHNHHDLKIPSCLVVPKQTGVRFREAGSVREVTEQQPERTERTAKCLEPKEPVEEEGAR